MSGRKGPPVCRRRGCASPREPWQFVCEGCWRAVPRALRDRYAKARRLKLTHIAKDLSRQILGILGRKPDDIHASTQAYARTAAMLGEREPAE